MTGAQQQLARAVEDSLEGRLDGALRHLNQAQASLRVDASLPDRFEVFVVAAQVLRHHGDHLRLALDAAQQALRLSLLPAAPERSRIRAELEVAACRIADGHSAAAHDLLPLTDDDPDIAGRAWQLIGEAALRDDHVFQAIAALLNAVAEQQRVRDATHAGAIAPLLLNAFSRAGHVADADLIVDDQRTTPAAHARHQIDFLLAQAEHERRSGRIQAALEALQHAEEKLANTSGLRPQHRQLHLLRAGCWTDWRQHDEADKELAEATRFEDPSPAHSKASDAASATPHPRSPSLREKADPATVEALLDGLDALPTRKGEHAQVAAQALAPLAGIPGLERHEAVLLLHAGTTLTQGDAACRTAAERFLRRAVVRLRFLEGMGLWLAQAQVTLGHFLAHGGDDTTRREALNLLTQGLQGLDGERFHMLQRSHRTQWLIEVVHDAFQSAVKLAVELEEQALAADLIVFSRIAGVVTPGGDQQAVPLVAVPRLRYIDGDESSLGSHLTCRLL